MLRVAPAQRLEEMLKEARWFAAVALEVKDPPLVQRLVSDPRLAAGECAIYCGCTISPAQSVRKRCW